MFECSYVIEEDWLETLLFALEGQGGGDLKSCPVSRSVQVYISGLYRLGKSDLLFLINIWFPSVKMGNLCHDIWVDEKLQN